MKKKALVLILILCLVIGAAKVVYDSKSLFEIVEQSNEVINEVYTYNAIGYSMRQIKKWVGDNNRELTFSAKSPPYISAIGVDRRTTNLPAFFNTFVFHNDSKTQWGILGLESKIDNGVENYLLIQPGSYTIRIESVGYKWYAKIGQ